VKRIPQTLLRAAAAAALLPLASASAQIGFVEVGPIDPLNGFPANYLDANGVRLDACLTDPALCFEGTDAVVVTNPAAAFPDNYGGTFPEEFFYNRCVGRMDTNGGRALLVMALEGAFVNGPVAAGDQIVFGRLRLRVSGTIPGETYTVTTPVGVYTFVAQGGGRLLGINFTDDIGLTPGLFTEALGSSVGPFFQWDSDLPVVDANGREYVGDPLIEHTITGSPTGTNLFRIDGPSIGGAGVNRVETNLFSVIGVKALVEPPAVVVADFSAAPVSGTAPLNVAFTDLSSGAVTSWSWDFGDGATSTLQNPSHSYAAGTYSVSLTATGASGSDSLTRVNLIVVTDVPQPTGMTLSNPVPGIAGVPNTLTVTGASPGRRIGFYTSLVLGASVVNSGGCPGGVPIGLGNPVRFLGTARANGAGVATLTTTPPASSAGRVFHFQAVDPGACAASNIVSDQL